MIRVYSAAACLNVNVSKTSPADAVTAIVRSFPVVLGVTVTVSVSSFH